MKRKLVGGCFDVVFYFEVVFRVFKLIYVVVT